MSRIRQDLRDFLVANAAIAALVGTKIFQSRIPKGDQPLSNFPALVYRRASGAHLHDLNGSAGYAQPRFQITAISTDALQVDEICEAVRNAMQGFTGEMGNSDVECVTFADEFDDYAESTIGDDVGFFMTVLVYTISHQEPIPG